MGQFRRFSSCSPVSSYRDPDSPTPDRLHQTASPPSILDETNLKSHDDTSVTAMQLGKCLENSPASFLRPDSSKSGAKSQFRDKSRHLTKGERQTGTGHLIDVIVRSPLNGSTTIRLPLSISRPRPALQVSVPGHLTPSRQRHQPRMRRRESSIFRVNENKYLAPGWQRYWSNYFAKGESLDSLLL